MEWKAGNKYQLRDSPKTPATLPTSNASDCSTLRRSVLSIARRQWKDRNSVGVTCSPTDVARVEQIGHSLWSDGITGHRGAIERTLLRSVDHPIHLKMGCCGSFQTLKVGGICRGSQTLTVGLGMCENRKRALTPSRAGALISRLFILFVPILSEEIDNENP